MKEHETVPSQVPEAQGLILKFFVLSTQKSKYVKFKVPLKKCKNVKVANLPNERPEPANNFRFINN